MSAAIRLSSPATDLLRDRRAPPDPSNVESHIRPAVLASLVGLVAAFAWGIAIYVLVSP